MAFKKPTVKRSATDISKITGFIMGVRKFGKTTLWADMINEKFGDPEMGLLVSCGMEHGTNMIDNINTTHINTYKEMDELKKWLISEKGKEHKIQMVCFDSAEEFFSIFESETIRRSNIENKKTVKSIKAAYGGYTNGEKECAKIVKDFLNELYNSGIIPWMIGHSKLKTVKDKASLDEEGFQKLGSSLIADYEAAIADCFDIAVTGLIDREIEERGDGDSIKRYVKETERRLYFRSNEIVEAGGRLKDLTVPEYIPFDKPNMAKDFIETVENALKAGRKPLENIPVAPVNEKPVVKVQEENIDEVPFEEDILDETFSESETVSEYPDNLDAVIRKMFKECTDPELKSSVREVISEYGKLNDVDREGLEKIYDMMK
ncbi:MAG: AAA family ATPase [Faecalimonas umbilicata]|uniref:AAA family ATPase n=1 Tax=Faecalimonas umbilicata TaxID=1912855 RepID=UPI00034EA43A|nr:hypothetical protein HMPREF1215_00841 [Coprococcus sp. HPP0074]DAN96335.1 MAG TPA: AAA domain protein [Caudoviricetes sp.]